MGVEDRADDPDLVRRIAERLGSLQARDDIAQPSGRRGGTRLEEMGLPGVGPRPQPTLDQRLRLAIPARADREPGLPPRCVAPDTPGRRSRRRWPGARRS